MPIFYRNSKLEFDRETTNNPTIGNNETYQDGKSMKQLINSRKEKGNTKVIVIRECRRRGFEGCQEWRTREETVSDPDKDKLNKELNDAVRSLSSSNETLNTRNSRRNTAYQQAVNVGNGASGGDYVNRRNNIRNNNMLNVFPFFFIRLIN